MTAGFRRLSADVGLNDLEGRTLSISVHVVEAGSPLAIVGKEMGEEVGAVLDGEVEVFADDEVHALKTGQVIVIPAGLARRYSAGTSHATLYRVVVNRVDEVTP